MSTRIQRSLFGLGGSLLLACSPSQTEEAVNEAVNTAEEAVEAVGSGAEAAGEAVEEQVAEAAEAVEEAVAPFDPNAPVTLSAVLCTAEGDFMPTDVENPRMQAMSYHDGKLYVQISARSEGASVGFVQRYSVNLDNGCVLTQDATWAGGDGRLAEIATGWGSGVGSGYFIAEAGRENRVFTLEGEPVAGECGAPSGYIVTEGDVTMFGVNDFTVTTPTDAGCDFGEKTHALGERMWEPTLLDGDIVAYRSGRDQPTALIRVKPDGTVAWERTSIGEGDAAREAGFTRAIANVGGRIVMGPGNPKGITVVSGDGELLGFFDLQGDNIPGWPRMNLELLAPVDRDTFLGGGSAFAEGGLTQGVIFVTMEPAE